MNLTELFLFKIEPRFSPLLNHLVYRTQNGIAKGFKRKGGLGFLPLPFKATEEERLLTSLDLKGKTVYDVGAAYGLITLLFASKVGSNGKVVGFEPNPTLFKHASENVNLNHFSNVKILPFALGDKSCKTELVFPKSVPGVGSLTEDEKNRMSKLKDVCEFIVNVERIDNTSQFG